MLALEAPFSKARDRMTESDRIGNRDVTIRGSKEQGQRHNRKEAGSNWQTVFAPIGAKRSTIRTRTTSLHDASNFHVRNALTFKHSGEATSLECHSSCPDSGTSSFPSGHSLPEVSYEAPKEGGPAPAPSPRQEDLA